MEQRQIWAIQKTETASDIEALKIRNLGKRSADEIMDGILRYQYSILPKERRGRYLRRVEELNSEVVIEKRPQ